MLKTTGITKKFEEMKNGGYTLFSDKTRKMLLAMGISLLSIGMFGQVAHAEMSADIVFKKNGGENLDEGKIRYQMILKESDIRYKLDGIYKRTDDPNKPLEEIVPYVGRIAGRQETLVVVEVDGNIHHIVLKNTNSDDVNGYEINLQDTNDVPEDNKGPEVVEGTLVQYQTNEERYLQAKFTDDTKIYRVEDQDGHNRVLIKEKDQDTVVNLKYILESDDTEFTIYDILGNPTTITLDEKTVPVVIKYHTRNIDGTQLALNVDKEFNVEEEVKVKDEETQEEKTEKQMKTYKLIGIKTGAGQNVPTVQDQKDIYMGVPSGTTKVVLIYEEDKEGDGEKAQKRVTVPLILDKEGPVVIAYKATGSVADGYDIEQSSDAEAKARAYVNGKKAIVEVKDVMSGIAKIRLLKGTKGNYQLEDKDPVYDEAELKPSLLKVFDVTENTTAVRVYDGVGNTLDLELGISKEPDAITIARLKFDEDKGKYMVVAQDIRSGLGSIEQSVNSLADYTKDESTEEGYEQYTLKEVEIEVDEHGDPIIKIYDALGNEKCVSFDEFLYRCIYATYSEHNDYSDSGSVSINVKDARGICRIEVTMVDAGAGEEPQVMDMPKSPEPEAQPVEGDENFETKMKIWNEWKAYNDAKTANEEWNANYRHTYTLEKFRGTLPKEVVKTYAIPDGTVESVMIYTKYEEEENGEVSELHNTIDSLINRTNVDSSDRIKTTSLDVTRDSSNRIIGAKVTSKFGIKQVTYEDGSVVRFYDELPTELYVNCLIAGSEQGTVEFTKAVVMDALGDTLTIQSDKITFSYNDNEI